MHTTNVRRSVPLAVAAGVLVTLGPAQTDPSVPGYTVSTYATGAPNGTSVSVDAAGTLYLGHEDNGRPTRIYRIGPGGGRAALYGDTDIPDPDVALHDPFGRVSGVPGSVLVGGRCANNPARGCITSVEPDGRTVVVIGPTTTFTNVSAMAWSQGGDLLWTDGTGRQVLRSTQPGEASVLFTLPATSIGIAVAPDGRIFTGAGDGVVRIHDANGTLIDGAFVTGLASRPRLAFAPAGLFGGRLCVLEAGSGSLYAVDANGTATVVGTGFRSGGLAFGPDGALYVTHRPNLTTAATSVLRIGQCNDARILADILPGSGGSGPQGFVDDGNGTAYFSADDAIHGRELWKIDAQTQLPVLVRDIEPGGLSSRPSGLAVVDGTLYFSARTAAGRELWRSDGTTNGTRLVADIQPGSASSDPQWLTAVPRNAPARGHDLYFAADDGVNGVELWISDGTPNGTRLVADIRPGPDGSQLRHLTAYRAGVTTGRWGLYFFAHPGSRSGLWTSEGTATTTRKILERWPGTRYPDSLTSWNGQLLFSADGGSGRVLWTSDGTEPGTAQLSQLARWPGTFVPGRDGLARWLFFVAGAGTDPFDQELFRTDGTTVEMVAEIRPGPESARVSDLKAFGSRMLFRADDGQHGKELWITDGTAAGTSMLEDINPGPDGSVGPGMTHRTVVANGRAWFDADDGTHGEELWVTDGTPEGTKLLADVQPGAVGSGLGGQILWGGRILFIAQDGWHGFEPWSVSVQADARADYAPFRPGCSGSAGFPTLAAAPGELPVPGETFETEVTFLPPGVAVFGFLGFAPISSDLTWLGMTGCVLHTSPDLIVSLTNVGGSASWELFIPAVPGILGGGFYQQVIVIDPAATRFGASLSNACVGTVGCR